MKIRLLLISLALAWQPTAVGQTCAQKLEQCKQGCESLPDAKVVASCKINCAKTVCAAPTPTPAPTATPLIGTMDVIPHRLNVSAGATGKPDPQLDDNNFLRNPVWRGGGKLPACDVCPCNDSVDDAAQSWAKTPSCTSQSVHINWAASCGWPKTDKFIEGSNASGIPYHMNWFPVEYEGFLTWDGHSTWMFGNHNSGDNEYNFNIFRGDHALETLGRSGVHLEFNSRQTVDHWDNAGDIWWKDFHHNVVDAGHDDQIAPYLASFADPGQPGPFAIVIGLLGLDIPHTDQHSELHPVYAMFIRLRLSPTKDKWAFFVRNWGGEGYCGPNDEPMMDEQGQPIKSILVRLQHPGSAHAAVNPVISTFGDSGGNLFAGNEEDKCRKNEWSWQPTDDGVLLTFDLSDPSNRCGWVGDLTIDWKVPDASSPQDGVLRSADRPAMPAERLSLDYEPGDPQLTARLAKLKPDDRKKLLEGLTQFASQPTAVRKGPSKPSPHPPLANPSTDLPNYGKHLKAVPDPIEQAREAKEREFIEAFLKAHGIE